MKLFHFAAVAISFLFSTCTFSDRCRDVTCFNGNCKKGICDCIEGYEGPQCYTEITPAAVYIDQVLLTSFEPFSSSGEPWDSDGGPDIFICINRSIDLLFHSETPYMDAEPEKEYTFLVQPPLKITDDIEAIFDVTVWDKDESGSSPSIGWHAFSPYTRGDDFPPILFLNDAGNGITAEISVRYEFP